ncbi:DNA-processing protein DprA [Luteibacter sp. 9133]|uniref:DNA-processing protein DprA n=1 Tax=Luteibacter sp. 9133 TaxID=1500891 RepID=UPI000AE40E89|nr:DNA-processing protein DprA [Luteibacter sp. 9133]
MLKGVGPVALRLIGASPDLLDENMADTVRRVTRLAKSLDGSGSWDKAVGAAARQRDRAEATGTRILGFDEPDFPRLLAASKDAPYFLWVRGRLAPHPEQSVAIIGTRKPTHHGTLIAERISEFFVRHAWSVVSGLALGCDAIAHRAALAAGGHTVAVLAHGLQTVAPASHKGLAEEIIESGGALVSEFAFGVEPIPAQFVRRDKTQAGLARGVVMVQSDVDGGSLHASRAAISYGRWLAVPAPTARDLATDETRVRANVFLAGQDKGAQRSLLHCAYEDLHLLRPLHGKDDYPQLLAPDATLQ